jgi:hypothetical protein
MPRDPDKGLLYEVLGAVRITRLPDDEVHKAVAVARVE